MLRFIVQRANKGGNVIVESYGAENLPEQDGFVLYPNHQGLYDVLAIAGACSRTFTVVAKKEVEHIPFLKQVFACIHGLFMDRENLRQSMQVINEAADVVKEGKNVILPRSKPTALSSRNRSSYWTRAARSSPTTLTPLIKWISCAPFSIRCSSRCSACC